MAALRSGWRSCWLLAWCLTSACWGEPGPRWTPKTEIEFSPPSDLTSSVDPTTLTLTVRAANESDAPGLAADLAAQIRLRNLASGATLPVETQILAGIDPATSEPDQVIKVIPQSDLELAWLELALLNPPIDAYSSFSQVKTGTDGRWYVRFHPGSQPTIRSFALYWKAPRLGGAMLEFTEWIEIDSALANQSFILEQVSTGKRCEILGDNGPIRMAIDFTCPGMGDSDMFRLQILPGPKSKSGTPLAFLDGSTSLDRIYTIGPENVVHEDF